MTSERDVEGLVLAFNEAANSDDSEALRESIFTDFVGIFLKTQIRIADALEKLADCTQVRIEPPESTEDAVCR